MTFLSPACSKCDRELVVLDRGDRAVAEFLVEDAVADREAADPADLLAAPRRRGAARSARRPRRALGACRVAAAGAAPAATLDRARPIRASPMPAPRLQPELGDDLDMLRRQFVDKARARPRSATGRGCGGWRQTRHRRGAAPGSARHRRDAAPPRAPASPFSSIARWLGNTPSSQPGRNTVSNSRPLALCRVIRLTMSPPASAALSITRLTCSRNPPRFSNSAIATTSSFRFSSRPGASGDRVGLPHRRYSRTRRARSARDRCATRAAASARQRSSAAMNAGQRVARRAAAAGRRRSASRAASTSGTRSARATACSCCKVAVPMPRRGVLTMRSKARSSAG